MPLHCWELHQLEEVGSHYELQGQVSGLLESHDQLCDLVACLALQAIAHQQDGTQPDPQVGTCSMLRCALAVTP